MRHPGAATARAAGKPTAVWAVLVMLLPVVAAAAFAAGAPGKPAPPLRPAAPATPAPVDPTAPDRPPDEPGPFRSPDLVELTGLDPTIRLDIHYARKDNFTGSPVYTEARAFLQRPAAEALLRANRTLRARGYGLLVFDGYRPWSVTRRFWELTPADKKVFACIGCHDHAQADTDPKHANIVGYRYDSPSCLRCHANGKAKFDHATLGAVPNCVGCHRDDLTKAVTTPASKHTANNFPAACESCHKSFTAWGPNTPMQHLAVGGATSSCQTCHLANFMTAVSPFNHAVAKAPANTCNTCHTDFTTWTKFVHNPTSCFNGATGATHRKATCAQCHAVPTDYKQTSCTACHRDRGKSCNG